VLTTTTLYTDSNVVDGKSYCYAATAVNSSSQESGYSNIASNVQIPAQWGATGRVVGERFFRPAGAGTFLHLLPHALRRGLHSFAASRLQNGPL